MISAMREYARGLKILLLGVIVVFILTSGVLFFSSSSPFGGGGRSTAVAMVNGEEIPYARFQRAQSNMLATYERMVRQRLTPEMAERLGLSQQVINELVTEAVVIQGAAAEGIVVGDDELRATIQQIREFQENGHFSRDEYVRVLRQLRLDPAEFEGEVRRQLVRRRMESLIKQGVKVSDEEVREAYAQRHEGVSAVWAYADLTPAMEAIKIADADLEPYVKAHQPQFTLPERRKLQYVIVTAGKAVATVSDAEIEAYYKEHASEFEEPKRIRVAHVLVRVPPVGGSDAENAAKAKIENVIKRARAGEDFGKLAREVSEDKASAVQGGDLGFVGPGELVAPFEQAAFALKKGEISDPVRTPFGYHAIRVLDVREAGKTPLKDAAPKIREALLAQKSERAAQGRADEVKTALAAATDFAAEAKHLALESHDVTFGRGDVIKEAGRDPQFEDSIFALAPGGVSAPIKTPTGFAVVKVVEQLPAGVPPVAEIHDRVVEAIKRERAEQQTMDKARALIDALGKGEDFAAAAKAQGFTTGTLPLFSRADPPKDRGTLPGGVLVAALQTPAGQAAAPVRAEGGVYVVKTLERKPAAFDDFDRERVDLEKQVLEQKRALAWDSWVRGRLALAKVEVGGQAATFTR
ncbi:MAG TPA: peptidylprolyl isomerase [Candidatus Bathyarchaeia archaeon]|nr:peptidylprolyl isomerase [Candidatus Bathyarchaeia archaeon]